MVVALLALFVAGAGGASAAKGLLDGGDIKNSSITGKDVKNFSLLKKDFKNGQLPAGPAGPQGPPGAAGRAGRDGFGALSYPGEVAVVPQGVGTGGFLSVSCPAGQYPTGGDAVALGFDSGIGYPGLLEGQFYDIGLDDRPNGWLGILADNTTGEDLLFFVDAICANASPPPAPVFAAKAKRLSAMKAHSLK